MKARGIKTLYVAGLATDFCVAWTAMDARKAGFEVYVIEDATRAIDLNGSLAAAWKEMAAKGVKRIGDVRALRAAQFREDGGPLAHPVQPAASRCARGWGR